MASLAGSLVTGGLGILSGYFQRKAAKEAATKLANAADQGITAVGDSSHRSVERVMGAAAGASQGLAEQTGAAQDYTNWGLNDSNQKLQDLLGSEKENLNPYLTAGKTGADRYTDLMTNPQEALEKTPGYQFQLQQGLRGVQGTASAKGALQSGGTLKALETYGQGLAGTTYQQAINNALAGSSQGLNATSQYNSGLENLGGKQAANITGAATRVGDLGIDWSKQSGNWNTDAAANAGTIDTTAGRNIADLLLTKGGASAAGTLGANTATTNMISSGGTALQQLLQNILKPKSSAGNA